MISASQASKRGVSACKDYKERKEPTISSCLKNEERGYSKKMKDLRSHDFTLLRPQSTTSGQQKFTR